MFRARDTLIKTLNEQYSFKKCKEMKNSENLFPFCNEMKFDKTIEKLAKIKPIESELIKIAMLVGESNFLSLLPELKHHAEIILLNDINEDVHYHTRHLMKCMNESETRDDFNKRYQKSNPLELLNIFDDKGNPNYLFMHQLQELLEASITQCGDKHFLSSEKRYKACKKALAEVCIMNSCIDLFNLKDCKQISEIIKNNSAIMTVLNLTNVHDYDKYGYLNHTIKFLHDSNSSQIILYSSGGIRSNAKLTSQLTTDLNQFMGVYKPLGSFTGFYDISLNWYLLGYLQPSERYAMGNVNKMFRGVMRLQHENNKLVSIKPKDFGMIDGLHAILKNLYEYNSTRKKNLSLVNKMKPFDLQEERIKELYFDIENCRKALISDKEVNLFTIHRKSKKNLGYQSRYDRTKYDNNHAGIEEDHYSRENTRSFFARNIMSHNLENKLEYRRAVLMNHLIYRLAFEIDYAINNLDKDYLTILVKSSKLLNKFCDIKEYRIHTSLKSIENQIKEWKEELNWNFCYVWMSGNTFEKFYFPNRDDAKKAYNDGNKESLRYRTIHGEAGSFTVRYKTKYGTGCEIPYFYPYRERVSDWYNFLNISIRFANLVNELTPDNLKNIDLAFNLIKESIEKNALKMQPTRLLSRGFYQLKMEMSGTNASNISRCINTIQKIYAICNENISQQEKLIYLILAIKNKMSTLILEKLNKGLSEPGIPESSEEDLKGNMPNQLKFILAINFALEGHIDNFYNKLVDNLKKLTQLDFGSHVPDIKSLNIS